MFLRGIERRLGSLAKNMGKCLGDFESHCLTNLRFADDVLLFSTSPQQLQKMMCYFKHSTARVGLKIHPEKTNILNNQSSNRRRKVTINNIEVEILPVKECAKFHGQTITFQQQETTEIRGRIQAAWAPFYRYKQEMMQHRTSCNTVFACSNIVITPTLSYAYGTWTLSKEHERMKRSTQRKLLRLIVPTERKYKKKIQGRKEGKEVESDKKPENEKDEEEEKESHKISEDEIVEGSSSNTNCDLDNDSFMNDTDEEVDTA